MDAYKLYRCTIISENENYFIGKDVHNQKYYITKNQATKNYKIGTDDTFYASISEEGILFKKKILNPITSKEYEKLVSKDKNFSISDKKLLEKLKRI